MFTIVCLSTGGGGVRVGMPAPMFLLEGVGMSGVGYAWSQVPFGVGMSRRVGMSRGVGMSREW